MGADRDKDPSIADVYIGVMIERFGRRGHPGDEVDRLQKRLKFEPARNLPTFLAPLGGGTQAVGQLLRSQESGMDNPI